MARMSGTSSSAAILWDVGICQIAFDIFWGNQDIPDTDRQTDRGRNKTEGSSKRCHGCRIHVHCLQWGKELGTHFLRISSSSSSSSRSRGGVPKQYNTPLSHPRLSTADVEVCHLWNQLWSEFSVAAVVLLIVYSNHPPIETANVEVCEIISIQHLRSWCVMVVFQPGGRKFSSTPVGWRLKGIKW